MKLHDKYALAYSCLAIHGRLYELTPGSNADDMAKLLRGESTPRNDYILEQAHAITRAFGASLVLVDDQSDEWRSSVDKLVQQALVISDPDIEM
jgi:hypothetical protein